MFFSCCFRNQKNKTRKDGVTPMENEKQDGIRREESHCLLPCRDLPKSTQHLKATQLFSTTNISTNNNETAIDNKSLSQRQKQQAWAQCSNQKAASAFDLQLAQKKISTPKDVKRIQLSAPGLDKSTPSNHPSFHQSSPSNPPPFHQDKNRSLASPPYKNTPGFDQSSPPFHQDEHRSLASPPHQSNPGLYQTTLLNQVVTHQNQYTSPESSTHGLDQSSPSNHQDEQKSQDSTPYKRSLLPIPIQNQPTKYEKLNYESNVPKTTTISVPNLSQESASGLSLSNSQIEKSVSVGQVEKFSNPSLQPNQTNLCSPSRSEESSPSHSDAQEFISCQDEYNVEKEVFVSKIQRSTASYGIKYLLQEQEENKKANREQGKKERIQKEKEAEQLQKDAEEKLSKRIREEYKAILEKNQKENELLIKNLQTKYEFKLNEAIENNQKNVGIIVKNGKNDKMAVIMKNKNDLDNIREGYEKLKSENDKKRQSRIQAQEEALTQSLKEVENKDRSWKEDKQEVLDEVQRLKKEAARMVAILSSEMEEDEEELSEEKKKNLKQEAESLQLVVEMRTKEVRRFREKEAMMERQLEEFQMTKTELGKMKARVEDLQQQIDNKSKLERTLYMENMKLEDSMEAETRSSARMSLEVEQLQWRIRNSLDLPPMQLMHSMSYQEDQDHQYLQDQGYSSLNKNQRSKSAPCTPCKEAGSKLMNNLEHVDEVDGKDEVSTEESSCMTDPWTSADPCQSCLDDMETVKCETSLVGDTRLTGQDTNCHVGEDVTKDDKNSDLKASNYVDSISSEDSDNDERNSVIENQGLKNDTDVSIDSGDDTDSLEKFNGVNAHYDASDEGLGDISSENESISPQPDDLRKKLCDNFEDQKCANNVDKSDMFDDSKCDYVKKHSILVDNRVPSRILFETPL